MSKPSAEKYSICHTYERSKSVIEERIRVIEKHLKHAQNAIAQFERKISSECEQDHDCLSVLKELNTIIYRLVQEKQQVIKDKFKYQRQIFLLNATDHLLLQNFIDIEPNSGHVSISTIIFRLIKSYIHRLNLLLITWARHVWKATKDQLIIEEDIALLQHRLLSTTLNSTSNLVRKIINNIVTDIQKLNDPLTESTTTNTSSKTAETLSAWRKDIIQEAIFIHQKGLEQIKTTIQTEHEKFYIQNRYKETTCQYQKRVYEAIENRSQHMIKRANCMKQYHLSTSFNPTDHQP
ncbi:unnamed protein product [Adineta ricciae]|uniref:Uncharacterized protein n=1 Tax=Adineta ricciae TaxID=249248 RepID=A0A815MVM5_ADIRI|nr:unnamed protein product [Adineta ricciae]CAF1428182.1 unnamed protein product [Adineta ricciae]